MRDDPTKASRGSPDGGAGPFDDDQVELARLVGKAIMSNVDSTIWNDARFVDWLAREAAQVQRERRRRGISDDAAEEIGLALMARALARRHRLGLRTEAPPTTPAPVRGTVGQVLRSVATRRSAPIVDLGVAAGVGRELWDEVVEEWLELPADLVAGQHVALRIAGDSMSPLMHTGDTVLVRVGGDVRAESVVVARHPDDGYVCKRVRCVAERVIELESLNRDMARPIITVPREPGVIVGTVVMVWCVHRT